MTEHESPERRAADDLAHLEARSERLEQQIEGTREDWERKKRDPDVPGAAGDPERAEGGPPPEQTYPDKRD